MAVLHADAIAWVFRTQSPLVVPVHKGPAHAKTLERLTRWGFIWIMPSRSAGILAFRRTNGMLEVLLVHPGGPFWRNKDLGAWSIPKGEYGSGEDH